LQARLSPLELAEEASRLAKEYNEAWLVVERNNHGSGVLAYLHGVNKYARIYKQDGQDGWLTSTTHRSRMLGALAATLVETPGIFFSKRLLQECRSFVRHRDGKIGASAGAHDDCVMAMAIGLCVREEMRI
jgi:hypothetical protein